MMLLRPSSPQIDPIALDTFLDALAGPDRREEGFVKGGIASDTPDGVIQRAGDQGVKPPSSARSAG